MGDNTVCLGVESCQEAKIIADEVYCSGEDACKEADISADNLLCEGDDSPCKATYATIADRMDCIGEDVCKEAEVTLSNTGQVFCNGEGACEGTLTKYKLGVFNGNHSTQCQVADSCTDAEIKTQSIYHTADSCEGANIYHDVMCVEALSCEDTYISQGSICCGVGCETANTRMVDEKGGEGCVEGDLDDDDVYGTCDRCGKETLLGWATANKTNIGIAITVVVLILLMVGAGVFFLLKKLGICGKTEEVDPEE